MCLSFFVKCKWNFNENTVEYKKKMMKKQDTTDS